MPKPSLLTHSQKNNYRAKRTLLCICNKRQKLPYVTFKITSQNTNFQQVFSNGLFKVYYYEPSLFNLSSTLLPVLFCIMNLLVWVVMSHFTLHVIYWPKTINIGIHRCMIAKKNTMFKSRRQKKTCFPKLLY